MVTSKFWPETHLIQIYINPLLTITFPILEKFSTSRECHKKVFKGTETSLKMMFLWVCTIYQKKRAKESDKDCGFYGFAKMKTPVVEKSTYRH